MDKPVLKGESTPSHSPQEQEASGATKTPSSPPSRGIVSGSSSYAWWLVLALVGLDCFSTLGYLPTLAIRGAQHMAPLAALVVAGLILFAVLPVYLYVAGRSPHGRGATGLLESHVSGWGGKALILFLLGFAAADFIMTRSLSVADAACHFLGNPAAQSASAWLLNRKEAVYPALPESLQGPWTDAFFGWWDEQLIVTVLLLVLVFGLFFSLRRGFSRGFLYTAAAIVALFLLVNGLVIGSAIAYMVQHPEFAGNWMDFFRLEQFFQNTDKPKGFDVDTLLAVLDFALILGWFAIRYLPNVALGLSGLELSMVSAPLVRGRPDDDPAYPRGRIRNLRLLLVAAAVLMSVLVVASVSTVELLVPSRALLENGRARDRALSYLAHGGPLKKTKRVTSDTRHDNPLEEDESDDMEPRPKNPDEPLDALAQGAAARTAAALNPLFGPVFGTLYDLSAVLILCLAGTSLAISLRDLLPEYLTRYGPQMFWTRRIGLLLPLFNILVLVVAIVFRARIAPQQWSYAISVLVLLAAAALAAAIDWSNRWRRSFLLRFLAVPFLLISLLFWVLAGLVSYEDPSGTILPLAFVAILFILAAIAHRLRSTALRYLGFTFADEESGVRWEQMRRLGFQVLVPHRPTAQTLAEKEAAIRSRHHLGADVPVQFVEVELGDAGDFERYPLLRIVEEDGRGVIRVSRCNSLPQVLSYIALELRGEESPPEVDFSLWGQDNIPGLVQTLIRTVEPNPQRQPRVVIG